MFDRARILVTDDDEDIQRITELNLTHEGFEVIKAFTGKECLEKVRDAAPDIIVLDLMMPEMDGFETCKRLKSVESTGRIPVIMSTAREALTDKLKCFSFKADDYLVKPYAFEELLSRIYLHLNRVQDQLEREQKQRTAIVRDVLRDLSEGVCSQYESIAAAVQKLEGGANAGALADLKLASDEIVQIVESAREREDPYYDSRFIDSGEMGEEEEDLSALIDSLEPPSGGHED